MKKTITSVLLIISLISPLLAQTKKQIIFAVMNDGKGLEPIVQVENGKMVEVESNTENSWKDFAKLYYKPKTTYDLIFGGAASGKATIVKDAAGTECGANLADITIVSPQKTKLKGLVRALATNVPIKKKGSGVRRPPTAAERTEIEKLVREEMTKNKISAANLKGLRYHNLTAIDVDNDKKVEFVGSFWLPTTKTERASLFFIAEKGKDGKYTLSFTNFQTVKKDEIMSGDLKDFDSGMLNELLLDDFDADGDGTAEIFTIGQAFEGTNFYIYKREAGKWTKAMEVYNYHCAF